MKEYKRELDITDYERKKAEVENRKFQGSTSWKVTLPVRLAGGIVKKVKKNRK
ncbi:hypothetical protein [Salinicoccus sp. CNSTN-B1]